MAKRLSAQRLVTLQIRLVVLVQELFGSLDQITIADKQRHALVQGTRLDRQNITQAIRRITACLRRDECQWLRFVGEAQLPGGLSLGAGVEEDAPAQQIAMK